MAASSRKLAAAVAARLARVVPPPVTVSAEGDLVSVHAGGKSLGSSGAAVIVGDDDERTAEEKMDSAVRAILDGVQDLVTRELREPWPREQRGGLALPNVRNDGSASAFWFGRDEQTPALALPSIHLAEVEEAGWST